MDFTIHQEQHKNSSIYDLGGSPCLVWPLQLVFLKNSPSCYYFAFCFRCACLLLTLLHHWITFPAPPRPEPKSEASSLSLSPGSAILISSPNCSSSPYRSCSILYFCSLTFSFWLFFFFLQTTHRHTKQNLLLDLMVSHPLTSPLPFFLLN